MTKPELGDLTTVACDALAHVGFTQLGPFGERHGSWVLSFHKTDTHLERFIDVGLTDLAGEVYLLVEVLIGAERERKSVRQLATRLSVVAEDLTNREWLQSFGVILVSAAERATKLSPYELTKNFDLLQDDAMPASTNP